MADWTGRDELKFWVGAVTLFFVPVVAFGIALGLHAAIPGIGPFLIATFLGTLVLSGVVARTARFTFVGGCALMLGCFVVAAILIAMLLQGLSNW